MAEKNHCIYWLCEIQGYCQHNDPVYLARCARADEQDKKHFAEHPQPDLPLYVDASSDDEDATVAEESGLLSSPALPGDTNNNMITSVDGHSTHQQATASTLLT